MSFIMEYAGEKRRLVTGTHIGKNYPVRKKGKRNDGNSRKEQKTLRIYEQNHTHMEACPTLLINVNKG